MSLSEFESCLRSDGYNTCGNLPQFAKFVHFGDVGESDTIATSVSTTVSTAFTPVLTTVSFPSTASPFTSPCDLTALKTFVKEEGFVLAKKVAKSAGEGLGDLSKKTLDSVLNSAVLSNFFNAVVDALPTGFIYFILTLGILGIILLLICYSSKQQAQIAAATIDALTKIVVVKNNPGIIYFLFIYLFFIYYFILFYKYNEMFFLFYF